jgi:hypothetical protein
MSRSLSATQAVRNDTNLLASPRLKPCPRHASEEEEEEEQEAIMDDEAERKNTKGRMYPMVMRLLSLSLDVPGIRSKKPVPLQLRKDGRGRGTKPSSWPTKIPSPHA